MGVNTCNICGKEVDIMNGGAAFMAAFCRKHTTNLTNVSFCAECYDNLLRDKIKALSDALCVEWMDV